MSELRKPFLVAAWVLMLVVVLLELGSLAYVGPEPAASHALAALQSPGLGIPYLALVDGILLFSVTLMALGLVVPARVMGRLVGITSFVFFLLLFTGAVVLILVAVGLLVLMLTLLLAVPFGTIAYMAAFADFAVVAARATLGTLMLLKVGFAVSLVLANPLFLEIKGLVLLVLAALLANVVVSFLHGMGPMFVVSILDAVAAIVVGVIAAVWALVSLLGSIPAIVKVLRVDRAAA
jgi:hypothetical protein